MKNNSGVHPRGCRVLVQTDTVEEVTEGGIVIPETVQDRHGLAGCTGVVIDRGFAADVIHFEESWQTDQ